MDMRLRNHERKMKLFNYLFRTLLHQLMTAQIRVQDLDLTEQEADETE